MTDDIKKAIVNGWYTIEIMGHQQVSGWVEECCFGSVVLFRVTVPALDPVEQILDRWFRDPSTYSKPRPVQKSGSAAMRRKPLSAPDPSTV